VEAAATPMQADVKADEDDPPYTYYVTGEETVGGVPSYDVTTEDPGCEGTNNPCGVTSNQEESGGTIPKTAVTNVFSHQD